MVWSGGSVFFAISLSYITHPRMQLTANVAPESQPFRDDIVLTVLEMCGDDRCVHDTCVAVGFRLATPLVSAGGLLGRLRITLGACWPYGQMHNSTPSPSLIGMGLTRI
jgi:hypothetical protein